MKFIVLISMNLDLEEEKQIAYGN